MDEERLEFPSNTAGWVWDGVTWHPPGEVEKIGLHATPEQLAFVKKQLDGAGGQAPALHTRPAGEELDVPVLRSDRRIALATAAVLLIITVLSVASWAVAAANTPPSKPKPTPPATPAPTPAPPICDGSGAATPRAAVEEAFNTLAAGGLDSAVQCYAPATRPVMSALASLVPPQERITFALNGVRTANIATLVMPSATAAPASAPATQALPPSLPLVAPSAIDAVTYDGTPQECVTLPLSDVPAGQTPTPQCMTLYLDVHDTDGIAYVGEVSGRWYLLAWAPGTAPPVLPQQPDQSAAIPSPAASPSAPASPSAGTAAATPAGAQAPQPTATPAGH